jgi:hypothetical protein
MRRAGLSVEESFDEKELIGISTLRDHSNQRLPASPRVATVKS